MPQAVQLFRKRVTVLSNDLCHTFTSEGLRSEERGTSVHGAAPFFVHATQQNVTEFSEIAVSARKSAHEDCRRRVKKWLKRAFGWESDGR